MEAAHASLVSNLSSSDPAKRIAGLSTIIQLANRGHDVSEYALLVLEKGFAAKQSTPLAHRLAYHVVSIMHLNPKDREGFAGIVKKGIASEDPEVATAALRALAKMSDTHLLQIWSSIESAFAACLSHRNYKVRQAAVGVMLAHVRSTPNRCSGVAMYREAVCKSLFESNAEVVDGAFHVLRELIAPAYPLYFHQEPAQPLYYSDAAEAFVKEYVWFSRILSRVPLCSRAHALRPVTLLYLHMDSAPLRDGSPQPRQTTAEDFVSNQLVPMLQFTGAVDVALEACHCIMLLCRHVQVKEGTTSETDMPEWVAHALWRVGCCLLTLLNAGLSPELKGLASPLVLEAACLARLLTRPDHVSSFCAQLLHYVVSSQEKVKVQLVQLCFTRLLEGYTLQAQQQLRHKKPLDLNTLVPLGKVGWWVLVLDAEAGQYDALRETAVFVMFSHLYGLLTQTPAASLKSDPEGALPLLAVAAQVTHLCCESLEWGYKTTRQFVVLSAYLKLLTFLVAELQVWRYVRADEQVERHVADSYQDVYMAVQRTLVNATQSTGVPMPTAVKGVLHCLLLHWASSKKENKEQEIFLPAVDFLRAFMEKVPHTSIHEPTAAMLVNHLLAYHAKKGSDATNESLQRLLEAVPPQWAKVAADFENRRALAHATAVESVQAADIHQLSDRFMGLALDTMGNTSPDWSLVVSLVTAHPALLAASAAPLGHTPRDLAAERLRHLLARQLPSLLFEPPADELQCPTAPLHRCAGAAAMGNVVGVTFGYKLSPVSPLVWTYVKVVNNTDVALKNVRITIGTHGSVVAFARSTTRPHETYDQGERDSLQITSTGFQDLVADILPGKAALVYRCAVVADSHPQNAIDVRVDLPRNVRADLLGADTANAGPSIALYSDPLFLAIPHVLEPYHVPDHLVETTLLALSYSAVYEVAYTQRSMDQVFDHLRGQMAQQGCFQLLQAHGPEETPNAFRGLYGAALRFGGGLEPVLLTVVGAAVALKASAASPRGEALPRPSMPITHDPVELAAEEPVEEAVLCTFLVRGSTKSIVQCVADHPEYPAWLAGVYRMDA
eukprot:EG_transcript_1367